MEYDPDDERELELTAGAHCTECAHELDPVTTVSITGEFSCPSCGLSFHDNEGSIVVPFDDVSIGDPTLDVNDDGTVTIPTYMRGDEVVDTADVDAEWLAQNRRADTANDIVADRLLWLPGVVTVESVNADFEVSDGNLASAVLVTILDSFEGSITLPEEIDGIPLRVEVGGPIIDT